MDPQLEAEVLKTCESIGFADEGEKYIADTDWELCVKDLILYLRRDDEDHSIRRLLGKTQVVGRDLLPLLKHNNKDPKTWEVTLRLLANLTHPALLLYDEEVPNNKKYLNYYYQLESYLRSYKAAFVDNQVWTILAEKLKELFQIEFDKRKDHQKLIIERILIVARNILHVPADPAEERRADDDTSLHDRILLIMHISGIFDILLHTASSDSSHEYSILLLEIMSLMFREQTGEQLAKTQWTRNEEDKTRDERELVLIREKEAVLRNIQLQKLSSRHSRFGGTYVLKDMKAPSGNDILIHKPITSVSELSLDAMKKRKRVAKNRAPMVENETTRRSTIPVRIVLKNFCASFVNEKYNRLMSTVKDYINRSRGEDNDETYYLWGLKFFMEFNRFHEFAVKKVSETMSTHTFHYVQTLLDKYQGMMVTDKEKIKFWSKRAHTALKAYQELLFSLLEMDKQVGDEYTMEKANSIKSNVFYLPEYRELLLSLLSTYESVKYSKAYLKDLIETNHLFLKMIEVYSSRSRRIVVKVKGKKKKAKKNSKKKVAEKKIKKAKPMTSDELDEAWNELAGKVYSAIEDLPDDEDLVNATTENVIPFDAASDIPIDEQKGTAVDRITVFLHTGKLKEAAILLRASREVWNTDAEYFGEPDITVADETELLKSIYLEKGSSKRVLEARTALENDTTSQNQQEQPSSENRNVDQDGNETSAPVEIDEDEQERAAVIGDGPSDEEEEEDEEDEEEEEERSNDVEQEFDFKGFVLKYAVGRVVSNYALLFQDWDSLKPLTLHCILKMFHRFVFDMDYPALMCQASLFLTFKHILQVADYRSDLKEAKTFFLHFWPKFVKLCENKNMFVEILFWKTAREAQEIQDGYAELRGDGKSKKKSNWTKDEDTELGLLVELYKDSPDEVKKAQKLIDFVMERWTWRAKTKRAFLNRLVERELIDSTELANQSNAKKRPPKIWGEEEVARLRSLYEEHKESDDIMGEILPKLEVQRSKKAVISKMLEIGLISDKSEVKKKGKRSKKGKSRSQVLDDSDNERESGTGAEREREVRSRSRSASGSGSDSSSSSSDSESDREANHDSDDEDNENADSYDDEKIRQTGQELMTKDMGAAIRWLKQSLKYYLEDIIDDPESDESVPLVPVGSDCILAIRDKDFKIFLKSIGISAPGVQETYWRIPSSFKKKDVELRLETLDAILSTESIVSAPSAPKGPSRNIPVDSDSESETASTTTSVSRKSKNDNDDTESTVTGVSVAPKSPSIISKSNEPDLDSDPELPDINLDSSDSEPELQKLPKKKIVSPLPTKNKSKRKSRIIRDDSDSESDFDQEKENSQSQNSVAKDMDISPEKSKILDDDVTSTVSNDGSTVVRKVTKRKRIVLDDSDEDDNNGNSSESNQRKTKLSKSGIIDSDLDSD